MTQANRSTAESTLEEELFAHLRSELCGEKEGAAEPVLASFLASNTSGATEIDVEELLQHYDGARLLLFSDDEHLAADREYVAAYLGSARPGPPPVLALPYFGDGAIARAMRARHAAPSELSSRATIETLARELGRPLPAGLSDLLQIALERGAELLGLGEPRGDRDLLDHAAERLHAAALRGPTIALIPAHEMRPSWVEKSFLRRGGSYETVAVWQSPPELYWSLRAQRREGELPHAVHLQGTWAFATLATHPIFRAAAALAARDEDVLLPPRPAHSARRADAPMIEMLLGAAELVRTMVQPKLRAPESVRVVTFLEPELETRLLEAGLDLEAAERVLDAAARGESQSFPEQSLVYLGQPRLALGLQAFLRVLVEPDVEPARKGKGSAREARYARIACGEALAFFASGVIAGQRLWPEDEEPSDALAPRVIGGLERIERALEGAARSTLVPTGAAADDEACAVRVGRFLGARLLIAVDSRTVAFESACEHFDPERAARTSARARLLDLARVALR